MNTNTNEFYTSLKTEVIKFLDAQSADDRIRALVLDLSNQSLCNQQVVLSNTVKEKLAEDVLRAVLQKMLAELAA